MMCILTQREIEFLAGLQKSWGKLYWREVVRVLADDALSAALGSGRATRLAGDYQQGSREPPAPRLLRH